MVVAYLSTGGARCFWGGFGKDLGRDEEGWVETLVERLFRFEEGRVLGCCVCKQILDELRRC